MEKLKLSFTRVVLLAALTLSGSLLPGQNAWAQG
jgi:hypothetical protein